MTSLDLKHTANLEPEVLEAAFELRSAFAALIAELPGTPRSAIEVERALRINKKLAWQVYRAATTEDALDVSTHAPGTTALGRVIEAAAKAGVGAETTARLGDAAEAFGAIVSRHADDRSVFDLMVSTTTGRGLRTREQDLKRADFRTRREIMGKYAEVQISTAVVTPGSEDGLVDICSIRGHVGLHRLRGDVPLVIARHRYDLSDGTLQRREPISATGAGDDTDGAEANEANAIALLPEYCSEPLPEMHQVRSADGFMRTVVDIPKLGRRSAVTCIIADRVRDTRVGPREHEPDELRGIGHIVEIATPAKVLLHDVLIDPRVWDRGVPDLRVLTRRPTESIWPGDDATVLMPIQESVALIGTGPRVCGTPEYSEYPRLVQHVCDHLGVDGDALRVYRCRVDYPVTNSVVWMRFDLS